MRRDALLCLLTVLAVVPVAGCVCGSAFDLCGNGHKDQGEDCDFGDKLDNRCSPQCTWRRCGDGVLDAPNLTIDTDHDGLGEEAEVCDWGIDGGPPCSRDCRRNEFCGDGTVNGNEACDDGNTEDGDGCDRNCTVTACGNGIKTVGEECDEGSSNSDTVAGGCRTNCTQMRCGDGLSDPGEQCEDGNTVDGDGCDSNCTPTACGNGVVSPGEDCDDQNDFNTDACLPGCKRNVCTAGKDPMGEPCFRTTVLGVEGGEPHGLVIEDIDGDGVPDVAVADRGDDTVKIFWGIQGGGFQPVQEEWVAPFITLLGDRPVAIAAGDLGGDGRVDLVTANEMGDRICVLENLGARGFKKHTFDVGNFPTGVQVGDFSATVGNEIAVAFSNEKEIRVYRPSGFSQLFLHQTITTLIPQSLVKGDLGGDGDVDLAWSAAIVRDVSATPYVAVNDGTNTLQRSAVSGAELNSLSVALWNLGSGLDATVVAGVYGVAVPHLRLFSSPAVDVNTAKWPIYLAQSNTRVAYADNGGTFAVFTTGNGTVSGERLFTYDGTAQGLAAGDLNGDGSVDLALSSPSRHAVLVFHGRGP